MTVCGKLGLTLATRIGLLVLLSVVAAGGLAADAEKEKNSPGKPQGVMHTIDARVTYSSGTTAGTNILAERQPGHFKVPAGQVARNVKYYFVDPKSGIERDKLNNRTIYCETTKSWVEIPADPATLELPPGEYKFVVGGTPGASGTLNFRTFASTGVAPPPPGGKPQPPTIRKPPPGDTPKTSVKPAPLHPGGEGRGAQRVAVHWKGVRTTGGTKHSFDGNTPAMLTIAAGRFALEFVLEPPKSDTVTGERAIIRWEGKIAQDSAAMRVTGATREDHTWSDKWGGQGFSRGTGTFDGRLAGRTWSGSMREQGETKASGVDKAESYQIEAQWSIDAAAAGKKE